MGPPDPLITPVFKCHFELWTYLPTQFNVGPLDSTQFNVGLLDFYIRSTTTEWTMKVSKK